MLPELCSMDSQNKQTPAQIVPKEEMRRLRRSGRVQLTNRYAGYLFQ